MRTAPLLCRLLGHRFEHVYAYGAESIGCVVVICRRRHCGHITRSYTETEVIDYPQG